LPHRFHRTTDAIQHPLTIEDVGRAPPGPDDTMQHLAETSLNRNLRPDEVSDLSDTESLDNSRSTGSISSGETPVVAAVAPIAASAAATTHDVSENAVAPSSSGNSRGNVAPEDPWATSEIQKLMLVVDACHAACLGLGRWQCPCMGM